MKKSIADRSDLSLWALKTLHIIIIMIRKKSLKIWVTMETLDLFMTPFFECFVVWEEMFTKQEFIPGSDSRLEKTFMSMLILLLPGNLESSLPCTGS